MARKKGQAPGTIAAQNRRARYDYAIIETIEAGIALVGTEVKSLRAGQASINECYATEKEGELYLFNAYIPEYKSASAFNHEPRRPRKLLLHKREIAKFLAAQQRQGMTIVPLAIYFNERGRAKVDLALARGKQRHDKRQTTKDRDWKMQKSRLMRDKG
jgi:SsrA-binding protein